MKRSFFDFVVDQWSTVPPVERADLTGKTVVVVGANTGLGFETGVHFARMNPARLILACRNEGKGKAAISRIESATGFKSCELWKVDLADFSSVTSFADRFQRESDRLDILVMNAGVVMIEYQETVDGWESSLQVNHLGTALLSLLLLPRLVDTGKGFGGTSRLVIVSSEAHYEAIIPTNIMESRTPIARFNSPGYRDPLGMKKRYHLSKLLNVFFARTLQDRLQSGTPLSINSVNPGFCHSEITRNVQTLFWRMTKPIFGALFARTTEEGARQLIYAAIGERDREDHMKGVYICKAAVVEPSDFVMSEDGKKMQENVWRETIEVLTKVAPQLKEVVEGYLI